jgi:hypothetical protein
VTFLTRIFRKHEEPKPTALVQLGIHRYGKNLFLCDPDRPYRGLKLVTVTEEFRDRYFEAESRWADVQGVLSRIPATLRPRRKSTRKAKVEPEGVAVEG